MKTRHDARLNLRCSAEFKTYLEQNAADLGISVTELIERSVASATITHYDGLKEIVPVMRRHGNNLNQIAHELHYTGRLTQEMEEILAKYRASLDLLYELAKEQRGE